MEKLGRFVTVLGILILIYSLLCLANTVIVHAQSKLGLSGLNNTQMALQEGNVSTAEGQVNFTKLAANYEQAKKFEVSPSIKIIDKEIVERSSIGMESLEKAKDFIKKQEGSLSNQNLISIDPKNISNASVKNIPNLRNSPLAPNEKNKTLPTSMNSIIGKGWYGLDTFSANLDGKIPNPPDIALAVGPKDVVQIVHHAMKIWDKNGTTVGTALSNEFFKINKSNFIADQRILFDKLSNRWFASILDAGIPDSEGNPICDPECRVVIAASETQDALGNWNLFSFPFGRELPDQPIIGVSDDKFVFSVDMYVGPSLDKFDGAQVFIIDKNTLINNLKPSYDSSPKLPYLTIYPIQALTPLQCAYMVTTQREMGAIRKTTASNIFLFSICGNPSKNDTGLDLAADIPIGRSHISSKRPTTVD